MEEGKSTLLSMGMHERPRYLLGYLAVKTVYRRLAVTCHDLFYDTDLFICFMNDYWFGDFRWERIFLGCMTTLNLRTEAILTIDAITEYFSDRWDNLYANVISYVVEYIAFIKDNVQPSFRNKPFEHHELSVDWSLRCGPRVWDAKQHAELTHTPLPEILCQVRKANARCKEVLDWEPFTIIKESFVVSNF